MIIVTHTHTHSHTHTHTGTAKNVFRVELKQKSRYSVRIDSFYISELKKEAKVRKRKKGKNAWAIHKWKADKKGECNKKEANFSKLSNPWGK